MAFKPLLAATLEDINTLQETLFASPKLDGIRCVIRDGKALSRSLKPLGNERLREVLSHPVLNGLDGELVAGDPTSESAFNSTTRAVRGEKANSDHVVFAVFDDFTNPALPFCQRLDTVKQKVLQAQALDLPVRLVQQSLVYPRDIDAVYQEYLTRGYEGVMLRHPASPYKYGRSTLREGFLLKLKPFADSEAIVIGYEEQMTNQNEATVSELGYTKRSSAQAGKVPAGVLGALRVRDLVTGVEFSIGGGFTAAERKDLWDERESLIGRVAKYKSCIIGVVSAPRFPVFLGWRMQEDM